MASICTRCALRIQRASQREGSIIPASSRAFSQSTSSSREFPMFEYSTNDDLNDALANFRNKHLVPAFLNRREQKLIFSPKQKDYLKENPQTIELGGEEIELQWIDRLTDRPARKKLVKDALNQIFQTKDGKAWENVGKLMIANQTLKKPLEEKLQAKIVRKAFTQGRSSHILTILQQVEKTGMTLKSPCVLHTLVQGFRDMAMKSNWEKTHVEKALKDMNLVTLMLESEQHGNTGALRKGDPRRSPEVLGVMLELAAVYAFKHADAKDVNGIVQRYADRLLSCMSEEHVSPPEDALYLCKTGPQTAFQQAIPVLHGVFVANKVLGEKMPQGEKARQVIANYESRLSSLASELESRAPEKGTYDYTALEAWRRMIRE
ncbi:hypothetical protein Slin15195_G047030 [Septoria linicola]|uniref:Uncharacterized protein n=1 Tax=Septoria linicola TaxID=215465 RepID=A0A9Q9ANF9_9PEZI|nr:hypothetical protein Slin14017_G050560 [Septoria linicola]USW51384.1 hypothetical protein Slin15195_G047030 [Septoria linicola]